MLQRYFTLLLQRPFQPIPFLAKMVWLVAFSLVLLACAKAPSEDQSPPRPVQYVVANSLPMQQQFQQTGEIAPHTNTPLSFRVDGRILQLNVDVGDHVKAGQVLATLDPQQGIHQLSGAKATVTDAEATVQLTQSNFKRMSLLANSGAISSSELDQAKTNYQSALAKQENASAALKNAQDNLAYTRLIASSDGVVLSRSANAGQVVSSGQQIIEIATGQSRDVIFQVPESERLLWQNTHNVTVQLFNQPNIQARAQLRDISPQADPQTRTWRVRATLNHPPAEMVLGATVLLQSNATDTHSQISIPNTALTRSAQNPAVFIITPQQTLRLQPIAIDHYTASSIVVATGLRAGDRVVTAGVNKLFSGQKVSLQEAF